MSANEEIHSSRSDFLAKMSIVGHEETPSGRIVFVVEKGGVKEKMYEYEMKGMKVALRQYRNRVSPITWNGKAGTYNVATILDHRTAKNGVLFFLVEWEGPWDHPIWRSEVSDADITVGPMLAQYKARMNGEKTEHERQEEKKSSGRV